MRKLSVALALLIIFSALPLKADVPSSYTIELPFKIIQGYETNPATPLILQGLREVLVKATGTEKILEHPVIVKALQNPDTYVTQFSYHQNPESQKIIRIQFSEPLIEEAVQSANFSILEPTEEALPEDTSPSSTLVWLVLEENGVTRFVGKEKDPEILKTLETVSEQFNVPVSVPLYDLTDISGITEQEVLISEDKIKEASKRYQPEAILVGKISKKEQIFEAQWAFFQEDKKQVFSTKNENLEGLLNNTLKKINTSPSQQTIILSISGITDAEHYEKTMNYLRSLPSVKDVVVTTLAPEQTVFEVMTSEDKEEIARIIALDHILIEDPENNTQGMLTYRLVDG